MTELKRKTRDKSVALDDPNEITTRGLMEITLPVFNMSLNFPLMFAADKQRIIRQKKLSFVTSSVTEEQIKGNVFGYF